MGLYDYRPYVKRISNDRQIMFDCNKGFRLDAGRRKSNSDQFRKDGRTNRFIREIFLLCKYHYMKPYIIYRTARSYLRRWKMESKSPAILSTWQPSQHQVYLAPAVYLLGIPGSSAEVYHSSNITPGSFMQRILAHSIHVSISPDKVIHNLIHLKFLLARE